MPAIEIVSHPLCPHAQRLVLTGLIAGKSSPSDYRLTYLEYPTLPKTATQYSENGELPVMRLDGAAVSTSTEHIAEYMNGAFGLALLPDDPAARLAVRGRERLTGASLDKLRSVFVARDREALDKALSEFFASLAKIEARLAAERQSEELSATDFVARAPIASLISPFPALRDHPGWQAMPRVKAGLDSASRNTKVARSQCPNYADQFEAFFALTGSAFPQLIRSL